MNREQAKQILLLYRPGGADAEEPEVLEAMALAAQDPELGSWFEQHQAFQSAVRAKLKQIQVPPQLKPAILARQNIVQPSFWQRPQVWIAAAAVIVLTLALGSFLARTSIPDRFIDYRESMVNAAVRSYGMDVTTGDGEKLRQFIAKKGAPADYELTARLEQLQLKGGGLLRWRGNPVSMVCFDSGTNRMIFLFVLKRSAIKDPPGAGSAEVAQVDGLMTASWTRGEDTYVLAGPNEPGFSAKYLQK